MSAVSYRNFTGTEAENYERYFVPAIGTPVSTDVLRAADLQPGEDVLDVACGTGIVARLAAERVGPTGSVTGIDLAADMIEVARTTSTAVEWHVGNAQTLPFADDTYDVVLCQMGLMFMEDRGAALAEMRRVLAPGGRLVVATPGAIQPFFEGIEQAIVDSINPELGVFVRAVFSMHDPDALGALLRDAGLRDVTSTVSVTSLHLPPPGDFLWQYINLSPMASIVAGAPEDAKAAAERQVVERSAPFVVDGTTRIDQPVVLATGRA